MFEYVFMQQAFIASFFIAVLCGAVGTFVVARKTAFFTHTLSEIGFSGAAFAALVGWSPVIGMLLFTCLSAVGVGVAGQKIARREASISVFSAIFIGAGILFLSLANKQSSYATNILFGSIIGVDQQSIQLLVSLTGIVLVVLFVIFRRLAYNSFDSVGAHDNTRYTQSISVVFLLLVACTVSVAAQIVGSLLIFALLTLPAASAAYFVRSIGRMLLLAISFALVGTWVSLYLCYVTDLPVSFFIVTIEALIYGAAVLWHRTGAA